MKRHLLPIILLLISTPLAANAGDFHLDATALGQVRDNTQLQKEIPVNGYLGLGLDKMADWRVSAESNMRFFRDFGQKINEYDLYQTVLHVRPVDIFQFDFGRQFVNQGFQASIIDGLQLQFMPPGYVDITVFSGIPRSVEEREFAANNGLLTGLTVGMKNIPRTNAGIHVAWQKNNTKQNDWEFNDSILVGADASHQFAVKTTPLIYGLMEYDVAGKIIDTGTAGFDIYPANWVSLNLEFDYYNVNRGTNLPTVFGILSQGRVMSGRFGSTWTLVKNYLNLVADYSYQNVVVRPGMKRNGHIIDTAFQVFVDRIGLYIEPGFYFSKSYGGTVYGARSSIREQFTDELYASVGVDFSKYTKITNNNDIAFSTIIWSGYEVVKGLTLSGGFEYNKNAFFTKDIRGSFKVSYVFDHNI